MKYILFIMAVMLLMYPASASELQAQITVPSWITDAVNNAVKWLQEKIGALGDFLYNNFIKTPLQWMYDALSSLRNSITSALSTIYEAIAKGLQWLIYGG